MKITDLTWETYLWPRSMPMWSGCPQFGAGKKHTLTHYGVTIVKVHTDEGLTGIGIGLPNLPGAELTERLKLKKKVVGHDPFDVEKIWDQMWVPRWIGRRGMETRVISAIDIGIWDLIGKIVGKPLYKLLGGYRDRVPAYVSGGVYEEGKGVAELCKEAEYALEIGGHGFKMKVGASSHKEDAERVAAVRNVLGDDIELKLDASNAWTGRYHDAIRFAHRVEQYDPYWLEEPVAPDDFRGHALVAEATKIAIATGENEYTRYGFRDLIQWAKPAILMPDPLYCGGITEIRKIIALAHAYDISVSIHGPQELGAHIGAGLPNVISTEYFGKNFDSAFGETYLDTLKLNSDGTVSPPDRPGLGIELNEKSLARYRVG